MEPEFIDDERIPLERDENNDDSVYEDSQAETSFSQEDEQRQQELDVEINALERGFNVKIPLRSEIDLGVPAVISKLKEILENS